MSSGKLKKGVLLFFRILAPVLLFVMVSVFEYFSVEMFLTANVIDIGLEFSIKNIVLLMLLNLFVIAITQYVRIGLIISEVLVLIVGIANYFLLQFRGYGIVMMDFFSIKTAGNVAGAYSYSVDKYFIAGVSIIIVCVLVTLFYKEEKHKYISLRGLLPSMGCIVIVAGFVIFNLFNEIFFSDVSALSWDHRIAMDQYGYFLYAVTNVGSATLKEPAGYSAATADKILNEYKSDESTALFAPSDGQAPNVILIMNEAYSDLKALGSFRTDKDYMEFYDSLEDNCVKGYLQSSVYGGYTSISEFEFLSGMSKAYIKGNPYLQYIKDYAPDLITNIKEAGDYKEAYAIHPYKASGYNRNRVYPLLGFDVFYDENSFEGAEKKRGRYITDQADFDFIKKLYEEKEEGEPLLLFNVTMQNHNPYTLINDYDVDDKLKITTVPNSPQAEEFLAGIRASDKALKDLVSYFEKQDEPTVIVMFGDHQPHLPDEFYKYVMGSNPKEFTVSQSAKTH
ncbi:MAG: sulfatase-like hydrolase/transferase, partial [Lachnospiraceae bacterium]|nr:sulfatase-like hydrolase/transferase [Lachnospiraceae bacterium]